MNTIKQSINRTSAFLFFLIGLNFMNRFYYLAVILFIKVIFFSTNPQESKSNINAMLVFLFCAFYCLFAPPDVMYGINAVIKVFSCYLAYLVGRKVIDSKDINEKLMVNYINILALGSATLGTLTLLNNVKRFGIFGFERIMPDFWTGELLNATSQSALFLLLSGISFYVIVILKKQPLLKLTIIAGVCMLILNALLTSSRTAIAYPIAIFLISYLSYLFINKKIQVKSFLLLNFILVFIVVLYEINLLHIKDFVAELPLFERLNGTNYIPLTGDLRFGVYSFFIQNMAQYPFGGLNSINPIYYMHNMWLDAYAVSGIFAFIFLILFTARIFINALRLLNHSRVDGGLKVFLAGVYLSFFLLFMSEPVLLANPWFFITFCLIAGMTDKYLDNIIATTISGKSVLPKTMPVVLSVN